MAKPKLFLDQNDFHLGQIIKKELASQGRTITWLAGEIHCTRENLYKVFHNAWISTDTLYKISEALQYDFFEECSKRLSFSKKKNEENCE